MSAAREAPPRPLAVRVLAACGAAAVLFGFLAFGIGALLRFDEKARIRAVLALLLFGVGATALVGVRPSRLGLASALVCCLLMLFVVPVGAIATAVVAITASQETARLRDYYGLRRKVSP